MAGLIVFKTLSDAIRAGFELYDKTEYGYLVRLRTDAGRPGVGKAAGRRCARR